MIHSTKHRPHSAADVEARGDDAERAPGGSWQGCGACTIMFRDGAISAGQEPGGEHRQHQQDRAERDAADDQRDQRGDGEARRVHSA